MSALSASRFVGAGCGGPVFGLVQQRLGVERVAEPLPHSLAARGDVDIAVAGLEHAGRDAGRMIVAGLLRHFAFDQPARGLEIEHEDLRLQQRGRDLLALAGLLPLEQRDQDAERGEQSGAQVGDRNADAHRPLPGRPVIDISPPMPCAIWSKPGRSA